MWLALGKHFAIDVGHEGPELPVFGCRKSGHLLSGRLVVVEVVVVVMMAMGPKFSHGCSRVLSSNGVCQRIAW